MEYTQGFSKQVDNLRRFLLNEITFEEFESNYEKTKESYEVVFETDTFEDFSKKMRTFF